LGKCHHLDIFVGELQNQENAWDKQYKKKTTPIVANSPKAPKITFWGGENLGKKSY